MHGMPTCRNCGEHVTVQFARVFGDNEDTVTKCIECVPNAALDETTDDYESEGTESWLSP